MSDNKETKRNRATMAPGGCECSKCGCIFIGGETHTECGICANEPKQDWAPDRIWLQRGVGDDGTHTWCSDSQDEHEEAEYVRVGMRAHGVDAGLDERDERAKFEAFVSDTAVLSTECDVHGFYKDPVVYEWWVGWQARAALARASEAAAGGPVPAGYKLVPVEPTVEMKIAGDNAGFWCGDKWRAMIDAAPQPASEQQPIPQVFTDTGDAVRGTFGKTVFAEMSNSDDLWPVWLDGWLRASEQQAARGLSDDVRSRLEFYAACYCKSTSATDREAGKAMYALLAAKGDGQ